MLKRILFLCLLVNILHAQKTIQFKLGNIYFDTTSEQAVFRSLDFKYHYKKIVKNESIDTVGYLFIQEDRLNNYCIAVGICKRKDSFFVRLDFNKNFDLTDEKEIYIPTCNSYFSIPKIPVKQKSKTQFITAYLKPVINYPYNKNAPISYKNIAFHLLAPRKKGSFELDGFNYEISVTNNYDSNYKITNCLCFIKNTKLSPLYKQSFFFLKDTLYLQKRKVVLDSITTDGSVLKILALDKYNQKYGIAESDNCLNIIGNDLLTNKKVDIEDYKNFVLLEFWGTWCSPCKELTPQIKLLKKLNSDKLNLLSIAVDDDITAVKKYLQNEDIDWENIYEPLKSRSISNKFLVKNFPTFILINPKGKILFRDNGKDGFIKLKELLTKLNFKVAN